jgi:replicative DNA helicase
MKNIPDLILKNLLHNRDYSKRVITFLKDNYFEDQHDQKIFKIIQHYFNKYKAPPTHVVLDVYFNEKDNSPPNLQKDIKDRLEEIKNMPYDSNEYSMEWLLDETESWGKNQALMRAIYESIDIYTNRQEEVHAIPSNIQKALGVSFRTDVGLDYFEDAEKRFDLYLETDQRFSTHLKNLDRAIGGGFKKKTLNVVLGGPGSGKSRFMVDLASHYVRTGYDTVFVTLELPEKDIGLRADANLLNYPINDICEVEKKTFLAKFANIKKKTHGKFFIKEYPMASINVNHLRHYLDELLMKKGFKPDFLFVDYLTIMLPLRNVNGLNSYTLYKYIAEELKGFASEQDIVLITGAQLNREGFDAAHSNLKYIAESAGIAHVADLIASIRTNQELIERNWIGFDILKNRLYKLGSHSSFFLGYDDDKMRHFDVEEETTEPQQIMSNLPAPTGNNSVLSKLSEIDYTEDDNINNSEE